MASSFQTLDRLLRGELPASLGGGDKGVAAPGAGLVLLLLALAAFYGGCMGSFAVTGSGTGDWRQILAGAMKVPLLFFVTLIITLPSLYTFNALLGTRLGILPVVHLMLAALGVVIAVLSSIGPIVAFFSFSSTSYSFIVVFNVIIFGLSGVLGLRFLIQTLRGTTKSDADDAVKETIRARVGRIFWIWMTVFALVGMQSAWLLRPFIGSPNRPFEWFRDKQGNFFEAVWQHLSHLLGW